MSLDQAHCVPCRVGAPKLTPDEINNHLTQVTGWIFEPNPDKITKQFAFKDFKQALVFINAVGAIAEQEGHHPNLYLHHYRQVKVELFTHKIGGLHQNDFIIAAKIDQI